MALARIGTVEQEKSRLQADNAQLHDDNEQLTTAVGPSAQALIYLFHTTVERHRQADKAARQRRQKAKTRRATGAHVIGSP